MLSAMPKYDVDSVTAPVIIERLVCNNFCENRLNQCGASRLNIRDTGSQNLKINVNSDFSKQGCILRGKVA